MHGSLFFIHKFKLHVYIFTAIKNIINSYSDCTIETIIGIEALRDPCVLELSCSLVLLEESGSVSACHDRKNETQSAASEV